MHHVQRCHMEHDAQSGSPAAAPTAKTKRGGRATFFAANQQKKRETADLLLFLRERNKENQTQIHF
jgi:hypothetical protein